MAEALEAQSAARFSENGARRRERAHRQECCRGSDGAGFTSGRGAYNHALDRWIVALLGLALSAFIVWFFWFKRGSGF